MKIKEIIYQTPEMSEEKLLEIMNQNLSLFRNRTIISRVVQLHGHDNISQYLLDEYDLIQDKKSLLTKSQRDLVTGFVGMCMIQMVKGKDGTSGERSTEHQSIPESTN